MYVYKVKKLQSIHADLIVVVLQAPCLLVDEAGLILKIAASFSVGNVADYPPDMMVV